VVREVTTKAGQKCTAIRRIIVPADRVEDVQIALGKRLSTTIIGDPSIKEVRMGLLPASLSAMKYVKKCSSLPNRNR